MRGVVVDERPGTAGVSTSIALRCTMSEHLITPRKSRWESFRDWCKSWSPQVKQGVIAAVTAIILAVVGWIIGWIPFKAKRESNVIRDASITATNVSGPVVLVQGNGNTLTVPQNANETASEKGMPPTKEKEAQAAKLHAMSEPLITPRK